MESTTIQAEAQEEDIDVIDLTLDSEPEPEPEPEPAQAPARTAAIRKEESEKLPLHPLVLAWRRRCNSVRFKLEVVSDLHRSQAPSRDARDGWGRKVCEQYCKIGTLKSDPGVSVVTRNDAHIVRYWSIIPDQYQKHRYVFRSVASRDVNLHFGGNDLNFEGIWSGLPGVYAQTQTSVAKCMREHKHYLSWITSSSIEYVRWLQTKLWSDQQQRRTCFVEWLEAEEWFLRGNDRTSFTDLPAVVSQEALIKDCHYTDTNSWRILLEVMEKKMQMEKQRIAGRTAGLVMSNINLFLCLLPTTYA